MRGLVTFQLECIECKNSIDFSPLALDAASQIVSCSHCDKKYAFGEGNLKRQLKKFAALCQQIQDSQEILGDASVAVTVGNKEVQVPFKLLLTRLKSVLNLQIAGKKTTVSFRVEPTTLPAKE